MTNNRPQETRLSNTSAADTAATQQPHIYSHLHMAALLLGGTALFSKLISLSAIDIIAYRTLICGLLVLAIAAALKHPLIISNRKHLGLLIICSLLFTVHWAAYFHAMQISTVAVGIVSMFTFPVITVLIEPIISKTKLSLMDVLMGACVLVGVLLIVPEFDLSNSITEGVCFGVISAFAVAIRNILVSKHLSSYSPFTIMSYHALISFAVLIPISQVSINDITLNEWGLLILLGSVFTAIPHTQKIYGLLHASAKSVSMIVSLQVVYASLFAYLLLNETVSIETVIGGAFILGAALFESVAQHRNA